MIDPETLSRLWQRHVDRLLIVARGVGEPAEDAVQEAFLQLARQSTLPDDPLAWLVRVTRNQLLQWQRTGTRRAARERHAAGPDRSAEPAAWLEPTQDRMDDRLDAELVTARLQQLTDDVLERALGSVSEFPHRLAVALPERVRAEVTALWPDRLPEQVPLQLSPRQLMEDFRAEAVGWRLPPEPRLVGRIMTASAEAAQRVAETSEQILARVADDLPTASVMVEEDQVVVEFAEDHLVQLVKGVSSPLSLARGRTQDSNQLKQVGIAMHNYYDWSRKCPTSMSSVANPCRPVRRGFGIRRSKDRYGLVMARHASSRTSPTGLPTR